MEGRRRPGDGGEVVAAATGIGAGAAGASAVEEDLGLASGEDTTHGG